MVANSSISFSSIDRRSLDLLPRIFINIVYINAFIYSVPWSNVTFIKTSKSLGSSIVSLAFSIPIALVMDRGSNTWAISSYLPVW